MTLDPQAIAEFRARLRESQETNRDAWNASRRLIAAANFPTTLAQLVSALQASSLPSSLRDRLHGALRRGTAARVQDLQGGVLRQLTGLPPAKALRALCLLFGLPEKHAASPGSALSSAQVEDFIRRHRNPFDLLLEDDVSSVLELGAGDLSFAAELVERYLPLLEPQGKDLTVHCVDRLSPGSHVGALYHADPQRLARLRNLPSGGLEFRFWGNQDMFELAKIQGLWPRYTVVTCQAPPTPTVAYEPSRLSPAVIEEHLRRTKGEFRLVREGGEEALEVRHGGRVLLFPPWKFEIRGSLAFLDVLARRGVLCILSAVDTEVFWELLSQLLADPRTRPRDVIFTPSLAAEVFGEVGGALAALPVGGTVVLSGEALRRDRHIRFRYVEIRRGALFDGVPASRTAKMFKDMTEEAPPWFLILIPEEVAS